MNFRDTCDVSINYYHLTNYDAAIMHEYSTKLCTDDLIAQESEHSSLNNAD